MLGAAGEVTAFTNALQSLTQGKEVALTCGLKCMMPPQGQRQLYGNDNESGPSDPAANIATNFVVSLETQRKTHLVNIPFIKALTPVQLNSLLSFNFTRASDQDLLVRMGPGASLLTAATATVPSVLSAIESLLTFVGAGNPRLATFLSRTWLNNVKDKITPVTPPAALIDFAANYFKWCCSLASSAKANEPSYNPLLTLSSNVQAIITRDARNPASHHLQYLDNRVGLHLDNAVATSSAIATQALAALAALQARVDLLEKPRGSSAVSATRASDSGPSHGTSSSTSGGRLGSHGGSSSSSATSRSDLSGLRNMCGKFVRNKHCSRDCKTSRGSPLGHASEFAKFSSTERADIKRCAIAVFGV